MPAVSVVLPIYNAQPYLARCLESVCAQTLRDIEIICVNDGSTDDSLDVIRQFASRDERFIVLDKPNGGYGHSMNYGIAHATGDFLAIVEPDDFLDPHMYEDLLRFADFEGKPADIVKASYWEFFDGRNGYEAAAEESRQLIDMPKIPFAFDAKEDARILMYHPSIWTAIYRRSWFEENAIRFIEPKGAGWADNPFVFETMLAANRVVWVPRAYYYYRLTNMNASSYLKDYHMPFDRMRDVRALLDRRDAPDEVRGVFYRCEFNYIASVIGEFGFSERDPEVMGLIREALESMDPAIVHSSPHLLPANVRYYHDFLDHPCEGADEDAAAPRAGEPVQLSILVPMGNDHRYAQEALEALAAQQVGSFEVLCVDCGAKDRTPLLCRQFALGDERFKVLPSQAPSVPDGINQALAHARGEYAFICDLAHVFQGDQLARVLRHAKDFDADLALIDEQSRFVVDAMRASDSFVATPRDDWFASRPFAPEAASGFLFDCLSPRRYLALYRTALLREGGLSLHQVEEIGAASFTGRVAMASERIVYVAGRFYRCLDDFIYPPLGPHDPRKEFVVELPFALPGALDLMESLPGDSPFAETARSYVSSALAFDLSQRKTHDSLRDYADVNVPLALAVIDGHTSCLDCSDVMGNIYVQAILTEGLEGYLSFRSIKAEHLAQWLEHDIRELDGSATMRAGRAVKRAVDTLLPKKAIGKFKGLLR